MVKRARAERARRTLRLALIFALLGALTLLARELSPVAPARLGAGVQAWQLHWEFEFPKLSRGALVRLSLPLDDAATRLYDQRVRHVGLRLERGLDAARSRYMLLRAERTGAAAVDAEFSLRTRRAQTRLTPAQSRLSAEQREHYLREIAGVPVTPALLARALDGSDPATMGKGVLAAALLRAVHRGLGGTPAAEEAGAARARLLAALARAVGIPARTVLGFALFAQDPASLRSWAELYLDGSWRVYDAEYGVADASLANLVAVAYDAAQPFQTSEAVSVEANYAVSRVNPPRALLGASSRWWDIFDFTRLPLGMRHTLATLLLLPFGVLVTMLARSLAGVRTYGTFSPTLLALAALAVDWRVAAAIFALVVVLGVGGRTLLASLQLPRTPRLSVVFTLVAISIALAVSGMEYYGLTPGGAVVLVPVVVLTSLVDRVYAVADEDGLPAALTRLLWTVVVGFACFALFLDDALLRVVLERPEVHLFTMALVLAAAAYQGPTLADLRFGRYLREPALPTAQKPTAAARRRRTEDASEE